MVSTVMSSNFGCRRLFLPFSVALLVIVSLLISSTLPVCGKIEKHGSKEYKDIKEDFLCRACVSAGEVFFDEVMPPFIERYRVPSAASTASDSPRRAQRPLSAVGTRQREQMIVEVHEAIDNLCATLEHSIQRQRTEAADMAPEDTVARQLLSPLVNSADLRDGVFAACPMALEEMNEALTNTAFQHLLPHEKMNDDVGKSKHSPTPSSSSSPSPTSLAEGKDGTPEYKLPAAGGFCEKVGLCSSFVHYHITSDAEVRRRAREAEAAEVAATAKTEATEKSSAADGESTASPSTPAAKKAGAKGAGGKKHKKGAKANSPKRTTYGYRGSGNSNNDEEEPSLWQMAQRIFTLDTWRELGKSLNVTEVTSIEFWMQGVSLMFDQDVWFHMSAYMPLAATYTFGFVAVLIVVLFVVLCCRHRDRAEVDGEKPKAKASSSPLQNTRTKKEQ